MLFLKQLSSDRLSVLEILHEDAVYFCADSTQGRSVVAIQDHKVRNQKSVVRWRRLLMPNL